MPPRRIALLIGINKYTHLDPSFTLAGCVNDQQRLQALLTERFGFERNNVKTLFDEQATRDNILDALDRLAGLGKHAGKSLLTRDDVVMIGYSGHGSRLKEPPDQRDEADGYDSTIIPSDSDRAAPNGKGGPNRDITDDELLARFERIAAQAGHLLLYFDCCHSGTISRDLEGEPVSRSVPQAESGYHDVPRLLPDAHGSRGIEPKGTSGWLPMALDRYVLIAGCADDEESRETTGSDGRRYGALTNAFCEALAQVAEPASYLDLYERARVRVTRQFPSQHPQIEGSGAQHLFGLTTEQMPPFARVAARVDDHTVRLEAGRMQGVRPGWRFTLHPLALGDAEVLARVEATEVNEGSCLARSDPSLPESVIAGCRAAPFFRPMGDDALPVAVIADDEQSAAFLRRLIGEQPTCRLVPPADAALAAVLLPARASVNEEDLAPALGPLADPTWVLLWADRSLAGATPQPADRLDALAQNVAAWAGAWATVRYDPPADSAMAGKAAGLRVLAHSADGNHQPLPVDPKTGESVATVGQPIVIELTNRSRKSLWMTLVDVGLMGRVSVVYPPHHEQIAPGSFRLGESGQIKLSLPPGFPDALTSGRETLKLILSEEESDFSFLTQEGAREVTIDGQPRGPAPDTLWDTANVRLRVNK